MNFDGSLWKISHDKDCVTIAVAKKVGRLYSLSFERGIEKSTIAKQSGEMLWQQRYEHLSTSGMTKRAKDTLVAGSGLSPNNCLDLLVQRV